MDDNGKFRDIMTQSAYLILIVILAALIIAPHWSGAIGFEIIAGLVVIASVIYRLGMLIKPDDSPVDDDLDDISFW